MPCGVSCRPKRPSFNTPKGSQIRRSYRLMAARLMTTIWRGRERMRRSSICFSTMPAMSLSILNSRLISESIIHHYWRFGVRTIRFSYLPERKHSSAIIPKRRSTFTQPATSLWKRTARKLLSLLATSSIEFPISIPLQQSILSPQFAFAISNISWRFCYARDRQRRIWWR
jgi:hypothetical protein